MRLPLLVVLCLVVVLACDVVRVKKGQNKMEAKSEE